MFRYDIFSIKTTNLLVCWVPLWLWYVMSPTTPLKSGKVTRVPVDKDACIPLSAVACSSMFSARGYGTSALTTILPDLNIET